MGMSEKKTKISTLDALSWKAHQEGISYGQLICKLEADEAAQLYAEYIQLIQERRYEEERRLKQTKKAVG